VSGAVDAETYRADSHERWTRAAGGWGKRRAELQRIAQGVSLRMLDLVALQPGQRVLELAAGPADTGLLAAELVAPGGGVIVSDWADSMVDVARARATELGVRNVEFRVIDAESIDLPTAAVDAVLCRWGYMLMADPAAALQETRRVLRPGGRVALAAWDRPDLNRWASELGKTMVAQGLAQPPDPEAPGMFAFAPEGTVDGLLEEAGFSEIAVEGVDIDYRFDDFDHYWDAMVDLNRPLGEAVATSDPAEIEQLRASLREAFADDIATDGTLEIPGRSLVAAAATA
jgi:SAM-dependent methyltransferase